MKTIVTDLEERDEFKNFIQENKDKLIVVKASATWCKPCKRIKDDFMTLFNNLPDGVVLIDLDIDVADDIASFLKIKKVPTIMNYVGGLPMDIYETSNIDEIKQFFEKCKAHINMGF